MPYPKTIFLLRHAEKTSDPDDIHLSGEGWKRAYALRQLFGSGERLAGVQFLFAADRSKHSNRSVDTLQPLCWSLNLDINHEYEDDEFKDLAKRLKSGKKYNGAVVLVAWHHENIPKLAKALGVKAADLPAKTWPDDVYDWVWILEAGPGNAVSIRREVMGF